jgi:hypothetical protein
LKAFDAIWTFWKATLQTWCKEKIYNYFGYSCVNYFIEGKNAEIKASSFSVQRENH